MEQKAFPKNTMKNIKLRIGLAQKGLYTLNMEEIEGILHFLDGYRARLDEISNTLKEKMKQNSEVLD